MSTQVEPPYTDEEREQAADQVSGRRLALGVIPLKLKLACGDTVHITEAEIQAQCALNRAEAELARIKAAGAEGLPKRPSDPYFHVVGPGESAFYATEVLAFLRDNHRFVLALEAQNAALRVERDEAKGYLATLHDLHARATTAAQSAEASLRERQGSRESVIRECVSLLKKRDKFFLDGCVGETPDMLLDLNDEQALLTFVAPPQQPPAEETK